MDIRCAVRPEHFHLDQGSGKRREGWIHHDDRNGLLAVGRQDWPGNKGVGARLNQPPRDIVRCLRPDAGGVAQGAIVMNAAQVGQGNALAGRFFRAPFEAGIFKILNDAAFINLGSRDRRAKVAHAVVGFVELQEGVADRKAVDFIAGRTVGGDIQQRRLLIQQIFPQRGELNDFAGAALDEVQAHLLEVLHAHVCDGVLELVGDGIAEEQQRIVGA